MSCSTNSLFGVPTRRLATAAAATAATVLIGAAPVHAAGGSEAASGSGAAGRSDATVLRTGLNVSLLNKTVQVPLNLALNEVKAPASANKTLLNATLDGVEGGKPVQVLRADVATARATVDRKRAEGYANLAHAKVHVPGLPLLSLIEVDAVTAKAVCEVGKAPRAQSSPLASALVLGQRVKLGASGTTKVDVPGVGTVRLDLGRTATTSRSAAATVLELNVAVDPLKLGVAKVQGKVTLAEASCHTPAGSTAPGDDTPGKPGDDNPGHEQPGQDKPGDPGQDPKDPGKGSDVHSQTGSGDDLAETGGSSNTPYVAGGAAALVALGGGSLVWARKRRAAAVREHG
ncbi:SCO1860 family LAETG-anchored protein [Streptomyces palmae]|uniref:SCO1860 family LAETG-anchored protein n=1 Tax=Streptomyces palmae TaxID=1701085 RepID=UPI001FD755ED|nr:SCO1860 family LAETG-anchored protein [Streptomyces palmae]